MALIFTINNLLEKKTIILFVCYKKAFTFASTIINFDKEMKATILHSNLIILQVIRVVVLQPRGEEGSCI